MGMKTELVKKRGRLYIVGAGEAGRTIAEELEKKPGLTALTAFFDDDPQKTGGELCGVPILGTVAQMTRMITVHPLDEILIAIPHIKVNRLRAIVAAAQTVGFATIKLLPSISQIVHETAHLVQAREISPQDLLARDPVTVNLRTSLEYLRGKRVLITGAGGSIGSELARQLLSGGAERLYLLGHGENSIYQIDKELRLLQREGVGVKATIVPIIGELKDRDYTRFIIKQLRCDAVFHTAAYKHVPLMEINPVTVIENNVFATKNLIDACLETGVKRFVLISTDKAVEPVSVYGVSKMITEKLVLQAAEKIQALQADRADIDASFAYMFVRFGNVLGSRGSIFPLWIEQIKNGGPVTVTHPDMERFFMTIAEACSLVLQTGGVGCNGNSYLLDMGEPVNILETAKQLIRYMGYEPNKDIPIEFIGLRLGERLSEPLWASHEMVEKTGFTKILQLTDKKNFDMAALDNMINSLKVFCFPENDILYQNKKALIQCLCEYFPSLKEVYDEDSK